MLIQIDNPYSGYEGPVLLSSGHRPFFLLAGLWAVAGLGLWVAALNGHLNLGSTWHGHEMLWGFAVAAISGFLMAAVPKWTNRKPFMGTKVLVLVLLWLAGRVAMVTGVMPWIDLVYLPVLAVLMAIEIITVGNKRNLVVPAVLLALSAVNGLYHLHDPALALRVATYLVAALVALIGGRIVPAFTQNALRMALGDRTISCETPKALDIAAVPLVFLVAVTELAWPETTLTGVVALAAGGVLAVRMLRWQTAKTLSLPLVWILHAGYVWVPLGFLMKAGADLGLGIDPSAALHALTAGAVGVMILAVASRAALGHSGRPLEPATATVAAYYLVLAAAVVRVFAPIGDATTVAGLLWVVGYGLFSAVYWPILTRPRIDGLPG
ncbi:MAG: NnrS family protein [Rhodobacterales bacterium]|nr:NnrS family protein [Rhodobacterales bacterium]